MWLLKYLLFEDFFYIMLNDNYNCFLLKNGWLFVNG